MKKHLITPFSSKFIPLNDTKNSTVAKEVSKIIKRIKKNEIQTDEIINNNYQDDF